MNCQDVCVEGKSNLLPPSHEEQGGGIAGEGGVVNKSLLCQLFRQQSFVTMSAFCQDSGP